MVAKLGPDPLRDDADPGRAWLRISRSRTTIGALLMDQSVLAGVGNVYRAEVLFRHRIDPMRPGNTLRRQQWDAIWDDLVELMKDGVEKNRIDTVRDEHTPEAMGRPPRKDDHGGEVYVYRRNGQPCLVCGTSVRTTELQQRNLFWCPKCQRAYRPRTTVKK
ncbi:DNA-formamidopyrimidine glycosylase [Nocardioidaceae bacterium Broad-1]|nr:DNA-formamidopyrimidine glycosylase [Nocardioidaceae bacterium Broad-1]